MRSLKPRQRHLLAIPLIRLAASIKVKTHGGSTKYRGYGRDYITYAVGGCGPTAAAMGINTLVGIRRAEQSKRPIKVTPFTIGDKFGPEYHDSTKGGGSEHELIPDAAESYGITATQIESNTQARVNQALEMGGVAIALVKAEGIFTNAGHFIVVRGMKPSPKGTQYYISDPNAKNNRLEKSTYSWPYLMSNRGGDIEKVWTYVDRQGTNRHTNSSSAKLALSG